MNSADVPKPSVPGVAWSILTTLMTTRRPRPGGEGAVDHSAFADVLAAMGADPLGQLPDLDVPLGVYLKEMSTVDPDGLTRDEALAFWMNVYNAAALRLGAKALSAGEISVLGVPGAFATATIEVDGESLSLDNIEHGKIRRFGDPRIHAGLVCGSVSCPTLRREPFGDGDLAAQLDLQMQTFLSTGALRVDPAANRVVLSPVFSWFGRDFTRPERMPTFLPARRADVLSALLPWVDDETAQWVRSSRPDVVIDDYDWRLGCSIA